MKMKLIQTTEETNGLIEVIVVIYKKDDAQKEYTFHLQSNFAYQKFLHYMTYKKYGSALNILKDFNCRKEEKLYDPKNK